MLESIHVKNIALIDEAEIEFGEGLNILTGETGAGKSILLGAIQLALGARAERGMIRQGAEYALAEIVFTPDAWQAERLTEQEIAPEDGTVILQRRIYPTKSICRINGETVPLKTMQAAAELLIDVHGQREHQVILQERKQEELLDAYAADALAKELADIGEIYKRYREIKEELSGLPGQDEDSLRELEFARFEYDEIEKADLTEGEDTNLEEQFVRMENARGIGEAVKNTRMLIESDKEGGILFALGMAIKQLGDARDLDDSLSKEYGTLTDAEEALQECARSLDRYEDRLPAMEQDYGTVAERLNLINHLKEKYGKTISGVLEYKEKIREKIYRLEHAGQYRENLENELTEVKAAYDAAAESLHNIRKKAAEKLAGDMEEALRDLNFEQCVFSLKTEFDESRISASGSTKVTFMIAPNPGEPLRELSSIASGGELSRIMLAQKSVFAKKERTGTLVFDEIDAGISGKTAWKVSEKLALLRKEHQVICITHLPQIAAMADMHFCIEKNVENGHTVTGIRRLEEEEMTREIARLLGTDQMTEAVLQNAKEMKDLADKTKQSQSKKN